MITKCRPIEIMRKKFSDFDKYEENENQIFLVGYEVDKDGNKKNIKYDAANLGSSGNWGFKTAKIEKLSKEGSVHYKYNSVTKTVEFDLTNCCDFIQINSVDSSLLSECSDADPNDGEVRHFLFDTFHGTPGKKTKILMREICPDFLDTVYIVFGNYIVAEVKSNQHVIIEILHTYDSEIIIARSEQLEISSNK